MVIKEDKNKMQLTEKGIMDYTTLIKTLVRIYNGEDKRWEYKKEQVFLGFGKVALENKEQVFQWILCLIFLVGGQLSQEKSIEKMTDGSVNEITKLEYVEMK